MGGTTDGISPDTIILYWLVNNWWRTSIEFAGTTYILRLSIHTIGIGLFCNCNGGIIIFWIYCCSFIRDIVLFASCSRIYINALGGYNLGNGGCIFYCSPHVVNVGGITTGPIRDADDDDTPGPYKPINDWFIFVCGILTIFTFLSLAGLPRLLVGADVLTYGSLSDPKSLVSKSYCIYWWYNILIIKIN